MTTSLVYSNVHVYRLVMNVLYGGQYRRRFQDILDLLGPDVRSVCDLCFGDTIIADSCRARGIEWTGVDLNRTFCDTARRRGHRVVHGSVFTADLPEADVFVMAGSLYHFHDRLPELFDRIWARTGRLVLSEPVQNLSSRSGLLGWWARRSANAGDGHQAFRFTEATLVDALRLEQARRPGLVYRVTAVGRDALLDIRA
jgi:hypothetical protein